jgi:hypothetical protein
VGGWKSTLPHTLIKRGKERVEWLFIFREKSRNLRVRNERIKKRGRATRLFRVLDLDYVNLFP